MKKVLVASILILLAVSCAAALTADDLVAAMRTGNPDILKAREEVSKALLDVKDAKAGYSPTIDLTVTGSYIANPIDPIRINLGDYIDTAAYGVKNDYITLYSGQESMYYQFSLSLTQPIFTWGKITNAVKLYQAVYEARQLQLEDSISQAQTEIQVRVAALYYLQKIRDVLSQQKEIASRLVTLADDARENGVMLATDALSVKVQASQIDVASAQIETQILMMLTELENLTGIKNLNAGDIVFDEELVLDGVKGISETGLESIRARSLAESRLTFRLLGKLSEIATLANKISGASVNWKPDFALVVNADYSGSRLPLAETDWYGKDDWSATITVALKTTVLDGGKAVRDVKRTASGVEEAELDIQSARSKIRSAVDQSWTDLLVGQAQIDYRNALSEQLDAQNQVKRSLLDTGYGSESDYLQGQLERNNCEIEILKEKISIATALYTLQYLQD